MSGHDPLREQISRVDPSTLRVRVHGASEYLAALEPRVCRCGQPTGSVALDECEGCERARAAVDMLHGLAVDWHARGVADMYDTGAEPGETRSE